MHKTCIKCGHINPQATGAELEACPACGAIYAKALPTPARPVLPRAAAQAPDSVPATLPPPLPPAPPPLPPAPPPAPSAAPSKPAAPASRVSQWTDSVPAGGPPATLRPTVRDYADRMRVDSLYPTFRAVINACHIAGMALGIITLLFGLQMLFFGQAGPGVGVLVSVTGVVLAMLVRFMREAAIMLADMGDAAVRTAMQAETRS